VTLFYPRRLISVTEQQELQKNSKDKQGFMERAIDGISSKAINHPFIPTQVTSKHKLRYCPCPK